MPLYSSHRLIRFFDLPGYGPVKWVSLTLLLLVLGSTSFAQSKSLEVSTNDLKKDNQKLQKELVRLRKSARKELQKEFPDFSMQQIDSIALNIREKTEVRDSASTYIQQIKQELINDLKETPEKLPVGQEVQESITLLNELESYEQVLKDRQKVLDVFNVKELDRLEKRFTDLQSSFEVYKKEFENWDEALLRQVEHIQEVALMKKELEKIKAYKPLPDGYRQQADKFQSNGFVQDLLEEKAAELKEQGLKTLQEKLDFAELQVKEAKLEFPQMPSIESAPPKHNPYASLSLFKRLKLGGNLQYNRRQPVSVDGALTLLYPINKKWVAGSEVGAVLYQKKSDLEGNKNLLSTRAFLRYSVLNSLFLQANVEYTKIRTLNLNDQSSNVIWKPTGLIGVGRKFKVGSKLMAATTIFYDLFHDPLKSNRKGPWVFRLGFELSK